MTLAFLSLGIWLYLFFAHGRFWSSGPELPPAQPPELPDVDVIVPARDEAATIGPVIASLLAQDYAGKLSIILIDDNSTDGTAAAAGRGPNLRILTGKPKPPGWSGKLWAVSQGVAASSAPLLLFTDADIVHDHRHISALVAHLQATRVEMVSEMVRLNCISWAERALVPAFVYFFQMLYPFSRVNDPQSPVAAAAGGTVLIRATVLRAIGGINVIRGALIDDVTLANAVKHRGAIYLGHSGLATSIRPYPDLTAIWNMITRTAFTQLRHSALLLVLTLLGLTVVWLVPVIAMLSRDGWTSTVGLITFTLAAASYQPTLARYHRNPLWAFALPLIALFYMGATVGSACNFWLGRGASWKSRAYGQSRE